MNCCIEGCSVDVMYIKKQLCQKHYFRVMRNGHAELLPTTRVMRVENPAGYQKLFMPSHPLAMSDGHVYEHRMVVFNIFSDSLPPCQICNKPTNWATCHIDHIDTNVRNNAPSNLRPLCRGCNTFRHYPPQHTIKGHHSITYDGITQTHQEWARDPRVNVAGRTITIRKQAGMTDFDALFSPKITHKTNLKISVQ